MYLLTYANIWRDETMIILLIIICVFAFRLFKEGMVEFYQVTYKKYTVYNKTHRSVEALYKFVFSFSLYAGRDFC